MKDLKLYLAVLLLLAGSLPAREDNIQIFSVSGNGEACPRSYVPPLLSNGSLNMLVDYQGCQFQKTYAKMVPGIFWAGRRYESSYPLIPYGYFEQALSCNGQTYIAPSGWTQTLNTREAVSTCRDDYGEALSVETTVFVPMSHDVVVIKKKITPKKQDVRSARIVFKYCLVQPKGGLPKRMVINPLQSESAGCIDVNYQVDGYRKYDGVISVMADKPAKQDIDKSTFTITAELALDIAKPSEITFYLVFVDSMDGDDFQKRSAQLKSMIRERGFDGLLDEHRNQWARYWNESYVRIPSEKLERAYYTSSYHLRANATKWSFPVGIFNTHWAGRFFGWDEMFCYQALVSSNHRDISLRCPEFRKAVLKKALYRAAHYGKEGVYGARYPWETMEDGEEGSPPGFWIDHIFHTSNIALSSWFQYLYTNDADYLEKTGYPVIRECARYFLANMIYEKDDGGMFIGKCTDLERLGPARINPFMTSCGAIYTLEAAAQAALLLKQDEKEAAAWEHAAAKLRASLPNDGEKYVPFAGCTERSVASLGGLFPYPVFDATNQLQRNAVYDFVAKGRASGNMYPVGNSVCAWYAGWMAASLAALGDNVEPVKLLEEAAAGAGCFGEMFEINEKEVAMHPWFSTASGNVVYALNQMLVTSRGDEIRIAAGVPSDWKNFAFKLACHGDLLAEVEAKDGKLVKLVLLPGRGGVEYRRTLVLPQTMVDETSLSKAVTTGITTQGGLCRIAVRFKGRADVINGSK